MSRKTTLRFCTACGQPVQPGSERCIRCGMVFPVARKSPFRVLKFLIPAWLVLLVIAGALGAGVGWIEAVASSEDFEDTSAGLAIQTYGEPQSFWLTDGPGTPGADDNLRVEQWLYPDAGMVLIFYDGQLVVEDQVTFSQEVAGTQISPTSLTRWMRRDDVESMLGEQGQPLGNVNSPYPDTEAYAYPRNRLLIGYLDGMFMSGQTY